MLIAIFVYSMCFDLVVLLLNTYKLAQLNAHAPVSEMFGQSRLTHMMWSDGLIYFFIACVSNSVNPQFWSHLMFFYFIFSLQFLGKSSCNYLYDFEFEFYHEYHI